MPGIVNVINFIRGVEPRDLELDLVEPVVNQIRLVEKHRLAATWLLQYDALLDSRIVDLLKNLDERQEVGAWFEVVQPMVEAAGIEWRGRFPWDWHVDVGFSVGYTPAQREKLADVFMEEFRRVFGGYPRSVGSWFMDAHLLGYLHERYGVSASCICKDQIGTDGYTLWGGYYSQAYYPSRVNYYMPAQTPEGQIPVPVFRMLGSDPIYQYDAGLTEGSQGVITLEPVYPGGGGSREWVDWFLETTFRAPSLTFGYAQVGQENSFGWPAMAEGLTYQIESVARMAAARELRVETLGDSADWYRSKYDLTPASAITALDDWQERGRKSVWYCSRFYRVNLFWDESGFRVRDVHLFAEHYTEPFLDSVCTEHACTYDTPPILDGMQWSDGDARAGIRIFETLPDGSRRYLDAADPEVREDGDVLIVTCGGGVRITCRPGGLEFELAGAASWGLEMSWVGSRSVPIVGVDSGQVRYEHNGYRYALRCEGGEFGRGESSITTAAQGGRLGLTFERS